MTHKIVNIRSFLVSKHKLRTTLPQLPHPPLP